MKNFDVIVAGDINIDLIPQGLDDLPQMGEEKFVEDMVLAVGGSAANTAIGLAKLGVDVALYGVVSNDHFGKYILDCLHETGVDTSLIEICADVKTGISIGISSGKDRAFISSMGNNQVYSPAKLTQEALEKTKHLHVSGYNLPLLMDQYMQLMKNAQKRGLTVSLDVGFDEYEKYQNKLLQLLKSVDVFFPNELEAQKITGTADLYQALAVLHQKVKIAVITRGNHGAIARDASGVWECAPFQVEAVDAVGAGDAFDAGFLSAYLAKASTQECLVTGSVCGALVASRVGGGAAAPQKSDVQKFLQDAGYLQPELSLARR